MPPWESGDGLEIWGSGDVILAKNQPNRLRNKQMGITAEVKYYQKYY